MEETSYWWDFYNGTTKTPPTTTTAQSSNVLGNVTDTANSWLDSLGSTFIKYKQLESAYDSTKSKQQNDVTIQAYENINQKVGTSNFLGDNKNMLIYGGIGLVGLFLIMGGRK